MTKGELIERFEAIRGEYQGDEEVIHIEMDKALLEFVDDEEVRRIFDLDRKFYA